MKTAAQILPEARALVEAGWRQGDFASDMFGGTVPVGGDEAACFCMVGALVHAAGYDCTGDALGDEQIQACLNQLAVAAGLTVKTIAPPGTLYWWNDKPERRKEDVLAVYDLAIKKMQS